MKLFFLNNKIIKKVISQAVDISGKRNSVRIIRQSGYSENRAFEKSGYFEFRKSGYFGYFEKSGYFVTVSGDLEIKNWFSNEPLLAAKEKK